MYVCIYVCIYVYIYIRVRHNLVQLGLSSNYCVEIATQIVNWVAICSN